MGLRREHTANGTARLHIQAQTPEQTAAYRIFGYRCTVYIPYLIIRYTVCSCGNSFQANNISFRDIERKPAANSFPLFSAIFYAPVFHTYAAKFPYVCSKISIRMRQNFHTYAAKLPYVRSSYRKSFLPQSTQSTQSTQISANTLRSLRTLR
jgi:hypothetical protein